MKYELFKRRGERTEKLEKKVRKIIETKEEKRNFLPLFNISKPQILCEEERKLYLMEVAKKYFEIKSKIQKENEKIG